MITIACLHLTMAFKECDGYTILLQSGLSLCPLVTLEKIHIETEKEGNEPRTISEIQLTNIFRFALRCQSVKELSLIISILLSHVFRRLQIWTKDSNLQQNCTLQLLKNASNNDIPIFHLELLQSFSKADAGNIILCSGLQLSCPVSLKKLSIDTYEEGRELTETEVVGILMFAQQSQRLEELMFLFCLLPPSIAVRIIPSILKSRKVKVTWLPYDSGKIYDLNLESGQWMHIPSLFELKRKLILDSPHNCWSDFVTSYWLGIPEVWQGTDCQKARERKLKVPDDDTLTPLLAATSA
ncbi:hypothetical protein BSL78_16238 [Apostichopus japonicus]|uniref:Uncharacterized protein n=1 Tax=Stichopus japonicus TaxID=307972 RepID=A0A2G8KFW4_STIJA|nr:hypothetical protein BSL78_16238 [Apostichopus japonicus]